MKQIIFSGLTLGCLLISMPAQAATSLPVEAFILGYEGSVTSRKLSIDDGKSIATSTIADGVVLHWYQPDAKSSLISAARTYECDTGFPDFIKFDVRTIGNADRNGLCNALFMEELKSNPSTILNKREGVFYRTAKGWYRLTFNQELTINNLTTRFDADLPLYDPPQRG